jgi:hypothetical protein
MIDHDAVDDLERALRRSAQIRRFAVGGVLALAVTLPFGWIFWDCHKVNVANDAYAAQEKAEREAAEAYANRPLTPAEVTRLDDLAGYIREDTRAMRASWQAATDPDALAAVIGGDSPCATGMRPPTLEAADSYVKYGSIDGNYFGDTSVEVYDAGTALPTHWLDERVATAEMIVKHVHAGMHARSDLEAAEHLGGGAPFVFVIATTHKSPVILEKTFMAGEIDGTAYAFDPASHAIACAGDVSVTNRSEIDVTYYTLDGSLDTSNRDRQARAMLERDLDVQLQRAVMASLRTVERGR